MTAAKVRFLADMGGQPIAIEKGKTYVLEALDYNTLSMEELAAIKTAWLDATGSECVVLAGMRIVREER